MHEFIDCGHHVIRRDIIKSISKFLNNDFSINIYDLENNLYQLNFDNLELMEIEMRNIKQQLCNSENININLINENEGRN